MKQQEAQSTKHRLYAHALALVYKTERKRRGLSQGKVAQAARFNQSYTSRLENGDFLVLPSGPCNNTRLLGRVAEVLGVQPETMETRARLLAREAYGVGMSAIADFESRPLQSRLIESLLLFTQELQELEMNRSATTTTTTTTTTTATGEDTHGHNTDDISSPIQAPGP